MTSTVKPGICTGCALYDEKMMGPPTIENPDIVVLGDFPKPYDIERGAFFSRGYNIIRSMFTRKDRGLPRKQQPSRVFTYGVRCCPEKHGFKLKTDVYDQCNPHLKMYLDKASPKVIIAMGNEALRSLGMKGTVVNLRGGMYTYKFRGGEAIVLPTYAAFQLAKQPGLVPVVENDIRKAYLLSGEGIQKENLNLRTPRTPPEIMDEIRKMKAFIDERYDKSGRPVGISMDTETTSVLPHDPTTRLIALSFSWETDGAVAIPFGHREIPQTPDQMASVKAALEEALDPDKVSLLMHNAKFDYQFLVLKYGFDLPFPTYDSMLAEHCLEEDKKGEYSLKAATKDYIPSLGTYEEELHTALAEINKQRRDVYKAQLKEVADQRKAIMLEHWFGLTQDERLRHCARWIEKGYSLGNYQDLIEVKRRKYKGEMVVLKKYEAAVEKMLSCITIEDLGIELPEDDLPEPEPATFEDLDVDMMLEYAAIDALVTRKITAFQLDRFREDDEAIKMAEQRIRGRLPTQPLRDGYNQFTIPLCKSIAKMEYEGVRIDRDRAHQYIDQLNDTLSELEDKLYRHVGYSFNTSSSSDDLRRILFEEMKYPVIKESKKTGAPSTDAETLKELYDQYDDEFLTTLMSHRKIDKCINTYLKSWLERSEMDGRIHCQFNQIGTATHRLSSSKPNLGHLFGGCKIP